MRLVLLLADYSTLPSPWEVLKKEERRKREKESKEKKMKERVIEEKREEKAGRKEERS